MRPRPYISFSQMVTFERSHEKFVEQYFHKTPQRASRNIVYGKKMADNLEADELSGDPLLDVMMARLPKFERMDKAVEMEGGVEVHEPHDDKTYLMPFIPHGKDKIVLNAKPDTAKADYSAFKEYKTSVNKWTQKMVDDSGQITFYATAIWVATKKIPDDIELVCVETAYEEGTGLLSPTGEMWRYRTRRSFSDIIKMTGRIRKAWDGIGKLSEETLI